MFDQVTLLARTVIVTGAGRGIGRATAIRLARDFEHVVLVSRTRVELAESAERVRQVGARAHIVDLDLRAAAGADVVIRAALEASGRIDALVNIAGAVTPADLFDMTDAQWDDGFALKFHGARRLTIAAWPELKKAQGSVILTSGATSLEPKAPLAAIGTVNSAVNALAKAFAHRGIADGVQVNSVLPGPVLTDRRHAMVKSLAETRGLNFEEAARRFADDAGISRFGQPEEIADLIAFIVSPAARWMTGSSVRMDGGEAQAI
jgi:3-oxoacyl-[acyl-carrier protein] reductase